EDALGDANATTLDVVDGLEIRVAGDDVAPGRIVVVPEDALGHGLGDGIAADALDLEAELGNRYGTHRDVATIGEASVALRLVVLGHDPDRDALFLLQHGRPAVGRGEAARRGARGADHEHAGPLVVVGVARRRECERRADGDGRPKG